MVRLALAMGLKHGHLEELLRGILIDEARRSWKAQGVANPNISQLSVTTGLNRKDVTARVRDQEAPQAGVPSPAEKTFTAWLHLAGADEAARVLPLAAGGEGGMSFEQLARQAGRGDTHHRAILEELIRLGFVSESQGRVRLLADAFIPVQDFQSMLRFVGDNVADHLSAATANTLGQQHPMVERAVFADGVSAEDCAAINRLARTRWEKLHRELVSELKLAVGRAETAGNGTHRLRVGIYAYHEDIGTPQATPAAKPEDPAK
jgi:hypothetical protein